MNTNMLFLNNMLTQKIKPSYEEAIKTQSEFVKIDEEINKLMKLIIKDINNSDCSNALKHVFQLINKNWDSLFENKNFKDLYGYLEITHIFLETIPLDKNKIEKKLSININEITENKKSKNGERTSAKTTTRQRKALEQLKELFNTLLSNKNVSIIDIFSIYKSIEDFAEKSMTIPSEETLSSILNNFSDKELICIFVTIERSWQSYKNKFSESSQTIAIRITNIIVDKFATNDTEELKKSINICSIKSIFNDFDAGTAFVLFINHDNMEKLSIDLNQRILTYIQSEKKLTSYNNEELSIKKALNELEESEKKLKELILNNSLSTVFKESKDIEIDNFIELNKKSIILIIQSNEKLKNIQIKIQDFNEKLKDIQVKATNIKNKIKKFGDELLKMLVNSDVLNISDSEKQSKTLEELINQLFFQYTQGQYVESFIHSIACLEMLLDKELPLPIEKLPSPLPKNSKKE